MGERHATGEATPAPSCTGVVRPQGRPQAGDAPTLGDILRLLADASAHAWAGDQPRAAHAVRRALGLLEAGLPPNDYTAEVARIRANADPATVAAFERRKGAA